MAKKKAKDFDALPTKDAVIQFIEDNPGRAGKREIAKAFGIKGADRIGLKRLLSEMADEGLIQTRRKKLRRPGSLPSVTVLTLFGRDNFGELIGRPENWDEDEDGPTPTVLVADDPKARGPKPGLNDRVLAKISDREAEQNEPAYAGRVIKVLEKQFAPALGIFRKDADGTARIVPVSKKQKEFLVHRDDLEKAQDGDLVSVKPEKSGRYGLPIARVLDVIGDLRNEKAISAIALHAHGIPHSFPASVLEEAESAKPATLKGREDWRKIPLITIDPADAKDHDDAVFAEADDDPQNEGGHIILVAIADVSHYVRPGSKLDKEAVLRGNSVYFPDRVVPMLPERISNDLCSLREGEDRPALAMRLIVNKNGQKRSHSFHRIMMRSAKRLSYQEAQAAIDGLPSERAEPLLEDVLRPLWDAYACVSKARNARAPLELNLPERKILLKKDGTVDRVFVPERLSAHKLIEEFMILANVAAAETLESARSPVVYRVHDTPSLEKLDALREFLRSLEIDLTRGGNLRPHHFNGILERVAETEHEDVVNQVVLRSQSQAEYSPGNIGHFGLNLSKYAHFTSPIRRYADLIVHRALVHALKLGDGGLPDGFETKLEKIAADISMTERRAMLAERDTIDRLIAAHLSDQVGASFQGQISGVTRVGLFVKLGDTGADGFVPASTLGWDYFVFVEEQHVLIGERTGERFRIGDQVDVKLVEAAPIAGALRFEMLSDGTKGKPIASRSRGRNKPAASAKKGKTNRAGRRRRKG